MAKAEQVKVSFINSSENPIKLFWYDGKAQTEHLAATLLPYEATGMNTSPGHIFRYTYDGERNEVQVSRPDEVHVVGPDDVKVVCTSTSGEINITVKPYWSPRGAARFLELVSLGYFDGCGLNRVVKKFLTQFGIGANYELRTKFRTQIIPDDPKLDIAFKPGFMSYAGSGVDSRSTEVFIVMPDVRQSQLDYFGKNSWETPFGYVSEQDVISVVDKWEAYGDMPPWGEGPDPQKIYMEDGYNYLKEQFPKLSYLGHCRILPSLVDTEAEEL